MRSSFVFVCDGTRRTQRKDVPSSNGIVALIIFFLMILVVAYFVFQVMPGPGMAQPTTVTQ
jgi:hypothetical protein